MITIVDYGVGNLGSVQNMLKKIGVESTITGAVSEIETAQKLLLPGVGAFGAAIQKLRDHALIEPLSRRVMQDRIPVLGICLGMQLLTSSSAEGGTFEGLGWVSGKTVRFEVADPSVKIPHKGWNYVTAKGDSLLDSDVDEWKFYFDHSYHVVLENEEDEMLSAVHGYRFTCGVHHGNIYGVQFHPEKSHRYGMRLLQNFASV